MAPFDKMEIFKSKTRKLDALKSICKFIDLITFYHLSKCVFKDCGTVDLSIELCKFIFCFIQIVRGKKRVGWC